MPVMIWDRDHAKQSLQEYCDNIEETLGPIMAVVTLEYIVQQETKSSSLYVLKSVAITYTKKPFN